MQEPGNWQIFWDNYLLDKYGKLQVETEDDLYFQVARTVNKAPVTKEVFEAIIMQITEGLDLHGEDVLVDFCCGNGLFTYELRDKVKLIIGVDFSRSIVDTANKYRAAPNIAYCLGSAIDYMDGFAAKWPGLTPNKYLMNESLAYFTIGDLEAMLASMIKAGGPFRYFVRGVPNEHLKWNYYNTEERKEVYYRNRDNGDLTNGGLGNWWLPEDIKAACDKLSLKCDIRNQDILISDYRMDIMISKT